MIFAKGGFKERAGIDILHFQLYASMPLAAHVMRQIYLGERSLLVGNTGSSSIFISTDTSRTIIGGTNINYYYSLRYILAFSLVESLR